MCSVYLLSQERHKYSQRHLALPNPKTPLYVRVPKNAAKWQGSFWTRTNSLSLCVCLCVSVSLSVSYFKNGENCERGWLGRGSERDIKGISKMIIITLTIIIIKYVKVKKNTYNWALSPTHVKLKITGQLKTREEGYDYLNEKCLL